MFAEILAAVAAVSTAEASAKCTQAPADHCLTLTPAGMFELAEQAANTADISTAEAIYRALASNPSVEIRSEARFRLALLVAREGKLADGATLLRQVLDEQPGAQRVRVELAGLLATMGDISGARRELRAAQAGGLPPEVAQMVDRFSAALRARKPLGGSLAVALASDSNINRATRSDTLGTIIGDFLLDEEAKALSGRGLAIDGQGYGRIPLGTQHSVLMSLSGSADLYRKSRFNDVTVVARAGPELSLGRARLNLSGGAGRRWFGGQAYTTSTGARFDVTHPIWSAAQIRASGAADRVRNHRNALESGWLFSGSTGLEIALSPRSGVGVALGGLRRSARDSGYSTTAGQVTLFAYREIARMTVTGSASVGRLEADKRLFLYPEKRSETLFRGTIGTTMRQLTFRGFAPTAQLTLERNRSSVEIYDYRRTAFELGITRAF